MVRAAENRCMASLLLQEWLRKMRDMALRGILMSKIILMLCMEASAPTDTMFRQDEHDSRRIIEEPQCTTVFLSEHGGYLALYQYKWVDGDRVYVVNDRDDSSYISPNEGEGMETLKTGEAKVYIYRKKRFYYTK